MIYNIDPTVNIVEEWVMLVFFQFLMNMLSFLDR